jgi:hypothetical protein
MSRMKKAIYKINTALLLLVGALSFQSCDNMLDIDPKDSVSDDHIYSSVKQFEYGVLGAYTQLNIEYNTLIGSIMADDCQLAPTNAGVNSYAVNINRWTFSADDDILQQIWLDYYHSVYKVNVLLENIHRVPTNTEDEVQKLSELKGELHGLRALVLFELHRIFGQSDYLGGNASTIPYKTSSNVYEKPGKLTIGEFYSNLWKDIKDAQELIKSDSNIRLSHDAIIALSARIALYQKDYNKASEYTSELINKYPLATAKEFEGIWEDTSNAEVIFKLKRNNDDKIRPNIFWYDFSSGKSLYYASKKLRNQFDADNDMRYEHFFGVENEDIISKYDGSAFNDRINDYKVFRISEMYLIRAEASLQLGNTQGATSDINTLRENRIKGVSKFNTVALKDILQERFLELSFEGHRYFDLKRLGMPLEREDYDLAVDTDELTVQPFEEFYQLPIPQKEIQANPGLKY